MILESRYITNAFELGSVQNCSEWIFVCDIFEHNLAVAYISFIWIGHFVNNKYINSNLQIAVVPRIEHTLKKKSSRRHCISITIFDGKKTIVIVLCNPIVKLQLKVLDIDIGLIFRIDCSFHILPAYFFYMFLLLLWLLLFLSAFLTHCVFVYSILFFLLHFIPSRCYESKIEN